MEEAPRPQRLGPYLLGAELGSGGMATVYLGRRADERGQGTAVAIKRLHPHFAKEARFVAALADEARLASCIKHPNVARTRQVVREEGETFLVMDFVLGAPLSTLWKQQSERGGAAPLPVTRAILVDVLRGLDAAHCATDESGECLRVVHRDVSPQNVLVGADGRAHLLDFGVAHASGRLQATTEAGTIKGKIAYMAPEQVLDDEVTARTDVYAAGVVLWEMVTGRRLYEVEDRACMLFLVANGAVRKARDVRADVPEGVALALEQALAMRPAARFGSARAMAVALLASGPVASAEEVSRWVVDLSGDDLTLLARSAGLIEEADAAQAVTFHTRPPETPRAPLFALPSATVTLERPRRRAGLLAITALAASLTVGGGLAVCVLRAQARSVPSPVTAARTLASGETAGSTPILSTAPPLPLSDSVPPSAPAPRKPIAKPPGARASAPAPHLYERY